jgi:prevent-host-death family protein
MKTATISELKKNLTKYIDDVADNSETLIINGNGKTVVMISQEDYKCLD